MTSPLWKTIWQLLKKLNIQFLYGPAILLLSSNSREKKSTCPYKDLYTNKQPKNSHQKVNGQTNHTISLQWNTIQ